jgi:hypothetical protein
VQAGEQHDRLLAGRGFDVARDGFIVTNLSRPAEHVVAFHDKRGTGELSHGRCVFFQMAEAAISGKCSRRLCGSSRNCGRSQRRREVFDSHAIKRNRREECAQMPGKIAKSDPQTHLGRPGVPVSRPHHGFGRPAGREVMS